MQVLFRTRGPDGSAAPIEFNTGMDEVPEAIDMAVRLMTPQEVSLVSAKARLAFEHRSDRPEVGAGSWNDAAHERVHTEQSLRRLAHATLHHSGEGYNLRIRLSMTFRSRPCISYIMIAGAMSISLGPGLCCGAAHPGGSRHRLRSGARGL